MQFTKTKILAILLLNTGLAFAQDTIDIRNNSESVVSGISLSSVTTGVIFSNPTVSSVQPNGLTKIKFNANTADMKKYILTASDPVTNREVPVFYNIKEGSSKLVPIVIINNKNSTGATLVYITSKSSDGIFANCLGRECSTLN